MDILISVIVPIYNVERYLDRCVKSIVEQTYKNLEIILVDDGSPDNCPTMCDKWKKKDARINVIHKENGGLSDARNTGLDMATGEFVLFVDSDDYIDADTCDILAKHIDVQTDIIAFGFRRVYDKYEENKIDSNVVKIFDNNEAFASYINRCDFSHMVCDKMFRLTLFNNLRFIKGCYAEDMAICYRLFGKARRTIMIDKTLYNYYSRESSIMGVGSEKLCLDTYKAECEAYEYGNEHYPKMQNANNTRFVNQSLKIYLKLMKRYHRNLDDDIMYSIINRVKRVDFYSLSIKTKLFYAAFLINKNLAWKIFKMFKLS